jgi:hypothetical protein
MNGEVMKMEADIEKNGRKTKKTKEEELQDWLKRRNDLDEKIEARKKFFAEREQKRIANENFKLGELLRKALVENGFITESAVIDIDEMKGRLQVTLR